MDPTKLIGEITVQLIGKNISVTWLSDKYLLQKFKHHTTLKYDYSDKLKSVNDLCAEFYHGTNHVLMQILQTPNGFIHIFYDYI